VTRVAFPDVFGIPIWLFSVGVLIILIVSLVLVSQTIARRWAQRRRELAMLKTDQEEAERKAEMDAQRRQQMQPQVRQQQRLSVPQSPPTINKETEQPAVQRQADVGQVQRPQAAQPAQQQQTLPISPVTQDAAVANKPNPTTQRPIAEQRCPNCGQLTRVGATYCPNCRFVLSPSLPSVSKQSLPITTPPSPVPEPVSQREKVPALSVPQSLAQQTPIQVPVIGTKETDSAKAIQATLRRLWSQAER
jgi:protein-disulfide isomerase